MTPKMREQLRLVLGHASYYKGFVKKYALITAPRRNLLIKDVWFCWDDACQVSMYQVLKHLGNKLVMGEDAAQETQVFNLSITEV